MGINLFPYKISLNAWLVWLSGLSAGLQIKGLPVQFPVRGTCLGCGPGPWMGAQERQPHSDVSLLLFLPPFPLLYK